MPDYQNGKIYKLICDENDLVYYGSTTQFYLCDRKSKHKYLYKMYLEGKRQWRCTSFEIIKYESCKIVLVENYPCQTKEELFARERYWIENNDCVNKIIPGRTDKEYYENNKEEILKKKKEYYENNKEEISKKKKEYDEKNKEKILKKKKEYYEQNKDKFNEYYQKNKEKISKQKKQTRDSNIEVYRNRVREYRNKNREKLYAKQREKIMCECGCEVSRNCIARHRKSKKHIKNMENISLNK